jgi:hypothetical protein
VNFTEEHIFAIFCHIIQILCNTEADLLEMVFPERLVADRFALVAERANGVQVAAHGKTIAKIHPFLQTVGR